MTVQQILEDAEEDSIQIMMILECLQLKERPNKRNKSLNSTQLNDKNNRKTTSQYHKHTNNHSHVKLQSERFKANYKTTSNSTYHHSSFRTSEVSAVFGTKTPTN